MAVNPGENNSLRHWRRIIEQDPARLGGAPVFRGTRVPVKSLFDHLSAGDSVEIYFPGVTRKQIKAVLALAAQHLLARRR